MSRPLPSTRSVLTSIFALTAAVAAGCGHSDK